MGSQNHNELLRKAMDAFREGEKQTAYELVSEILEEDEENVRAWMLFSRVTDDVNEKRIALTTVLKLDPGNVKAQEALDKLETKAARRRGGEIAPGINRRQVALIAGGTGGAILLILLLILGINASREGENRRIAEEAQRVVADQTNFAMQQTSDFGTQSAVAAEGTATQLAITSPTPTPTSTRAGPTLPPTFTPTPTSTPIVTATPLAPPIGLGGTIIGWGGPDRLNEGYLPVVSIPLNGGGQFSEISLDMRGRNVAATGLNNVVFARYFRDNFDWALSRIDVGQGTVGILQQELQGRTAQIFTKSDQPQFSADGTKLVFSAVDQTSAIVNVYVYDLLAPIGTDPIIKVSTDGNRYGYPTISTDGRLIVAVRYDDNPLAPAQDLMYLDTQTLAMRPLTTDGNATLETMPRLSPDGQVLAYAAAAPDGTNDIYIRTADGTGGALNVTNHPGDDILPVFSSDSRYLAFSSNRQGPYNIYIYDMLQSQMYQLTTLNEDFFVGAWIP